MSISYKPLNIHFPRQKADIIKVINYCLLFVDMSEIKVRPLSPELAAKAAEELNEDPKRIPSDIKHIREWFSKQPHLAHIKLSMNTNRCLFS